jgi:putative endonuclease
MTCWVYMLSNRKGLTYTGWCFNIRERLREHFWRRNQFTGKYRITRLVFLEEHPTRDSATTREKQIKGWRREKKHALIQATNPGWDDLSEPFR